MKTPTKLRHAVEVFRSDENPKHLFIYVYSKDTPHPSTLKTLETLRNLVRVAESKLVKNIQRIGLPAGGVITNSDWGLLRTDDNVNIMIIRLTGTEEFLVEDKDIATRLNCLVWHPSNLWLAEVCKYAIEPPEGTILERVFQ